ncbi:MAG: ABC transporter ATP-binding protein [Lachnospiraceae bacterium]|nr:ABC transporter ATP-binding protein [Lachnospiraceae bacterium]
METIISFENVTKTYDGKNVIDHVSHEFYRGESVAFIGHNGCGKSTMLKLLGGLIFASSGKIHRQKKTRFSYVPEKFPGMLIPMLDYLKRIADMEGVEQSEVRRLIGEFFLEGMIHARLNELSKGSLQKVGVIQALLAPCDIILLDEPLSGQDAASQEVFILKVNELRGKGVTVFMSCHEKKLVDELSDRVYAIEQGKPADVKEERESIFAVTVRKKEGMRVWPDMKDAGNKYLLRVREADVKETVLRLFEEGWELAGVEEYL